MELSPARRDVLRNVRAVLFDLFGTVVDWRSSVTAQLAAYGAAHGVAADWEQVALDWRGEYRPSMNEVLEGHRPWVSLDVLNRESLERVTRRHGVELPTSHLDELTRAWHRLDPWADVIAGLHELRRHVRIGTLSNGCDAQLTAIAAYAGLPWDVLLGAETVHTYKPDPHMYLGNVALLDLAPRQVMLVAAHNDDLAAARALGLRTGFIPRPTEYGPAQTRDLTAECPWDVVASDVGDLAEIVAVARQPEAL